MKLKFADALRRGDVCVAMQSASLPALVTLALIDQACAGADLVSMHLKWKPITAVKHFRDNDDDDDDTGLSTKM